MDLFTNTKLKIMAYVRIFKYLSNGFVRQTLFRHIYTVLSENCKQYKRYILLLWRKIYAFVKKQAEQKAKSNNPFNYVFATYKELFSIIFAFLLLSLWLLYQRKKHMSQIIKNRKFDSGQIDFQGIQGIPNKKQVNILGKRLGHNIVKHKKIEQKDEQVDSCCEQLHKDLTQSFQKKRNNKKDQLFYAILQNYSNLHHKKHKKQSKHLNNSNQTDDQFLTEHNDINCRKILYKSQNLQNFLIDTKETWQEKQYLNQSQEYGKKVSS